MNVDWGSDGSRVESYLSIGRVLNVDVLFLLARTYDCVSTGIYEQWFDE